MSLTGKMINCPILHVNGDDPEAVLKAASIAVEYQKRFKRFVFCIYAALEEYL